MNQRKFQILGVVLLLVFAGFTLASFQETLTPYVSYDKAREMNRTVQVAGGLEADSSSYDEAGQALFFTLEDPENGDTLRVRYNGLKPANFEEAISIVAIGHYDSTNEQLEAEKLLVKCPSKYQGVEMEEKTYS